MSDDTTQAILDATRSSILDLGVRRTTLTEVARRADVSRMTVYRHYPDVDAILRDLMTRDVALGMKLIRFDRKEFKRRYGFDVVALCKSTVDALIAEDLLRVDENALELTHKGILWGDYVGHCLAEALEAHDS